MEKERMKIMQALSILHDYDVRRTAKGRTRMSDREYHALDVCIRFLMYLETYELLDETEDEFIRLERNGGYINDEDSPYVLD